MTHWPSILEGGPKGWYPNGQAELIDLETNRKISESILDHALKAKAELEVDHKYLQELELLTRESWQACISLSERIIRTGINVGFFGDNSAFGLSIANLVLAGCDYNEILSLIVKRRAQELKCLRKAVGRLRSILKHFGLISGTFQCLKLRRFLMMLLGVGKSDPDDSKCCLTIIESLLAERSGEPAFYQSFSHD